MKIQNWDGKKIPLDHDAIYGQLKYHLLTAPKEKMFPGMAMRPMFEFILKSLHHTTGLIGAEIGVHVARNSYNIATLLPIQKLYLIDPYGAYTQDGVATNLENTNTKYIEQIAHKRMRRFGDKIVWIKDYSSNATNRLPDNLDFVYIDGNHEYVFVMEDIELYYPKVRKGGVIGGHDFDGSNRGVARASIEFADKHHLELLGGKIDWFIVKE